MRGTRVTHELPRLLLAAAAACLPAIPMGVSATDAAPASRQPATASKEASALKFDVSASRWTFRSRGVSFKEAARAIEAKAPVDIRIQDPALESVEFGVVVDAPDAREGMRQLLSGFNYSDFADPKTGRQVYLVTSLASEVRRTVPEAPTTAVAAAAPAGAPKATVSTAQTIDEFRRVQPAQIESREQPQAEIDREFQRERDQRLLRAIDVLANPDLPSTLHRDALVDLARSGDPRATPALRSAMSQVAALPGDAAPHVARSVWQHAAQLQFADPDANALLISLGTSPNAKVREVAQTAKRDMDRFRAAQNAPAGR